MLPPSTPFAPHPPEKAPHQLSTETPRQPEPPPPPPVTSCIIAASAGTGKTYQLSLRFIALLALGVPPEQMIALTFTRKAAGEFCDRILRDLARGAASTEGAGELAERIRHLWQGQGNTPPLCPAAQTHPHPLTRQHFHHLLQDLSTALGKVRLTTLDSFFFSLLSVSLYDLGISTLTLLDDTGKQQARRQAQDSLFESLSDDDTQLQSFLEHFSALTESHRGNLREAFDDIIRTYSDLFLAAPDGAIWSHPEAFHLPNLLSSPDLSPDDYDRANRRMQSLQGSCNAPPQLLKGLLAFSGKMKAHNLKGISTVLKHLDNPPPNATPALLSMLQLASQLYEATRLDILRQSQKRTLAIYELLRQYQQHYQALVRNSGNYDFSDITRAIPRLLEKQQAPTRLAYRLDSTLRHWMLDEFQDTAPDQWRALQPLLSEILAEIGHTPHGAATRSLFIVGDTKQSIYGWRGASAELFEQLQQLPGLQHMNMVTSWRSAPPILDWVNHVFRYHGTPLQHRSAHPHLSGYVQILSYDPTGEHGSGLGESIAGILHSLPLAEKQMSIGILTRSNEQASAIASWLKQNTTYPISSLSELPIGTDSPLGETLLSFFRWLAHPSDTYSHSVWHNSPLQPLIQESAFPWQHWQQRLETDGYAAILRTLQSGMKRIGLTLTAYHESRLKHWILNAAEFDRAGRSLADWIEHMQNLTLRENPPKHVIQVLTIHKSKGLEYDAVILPFQSTQEPQNTRHLNALLTRDPSGAPSGVIIPPGSQEKRDLWPELAPHVSAWQERQLAENRNLLYVALTRAARANYILVTNKAQTGKTYHAGIMLDTLEHITRQIDQHQLGESAALSRPHPISQDSTGEIFHMGEPAWHRDQPARISPPPPTAPPSLPPPPRRRARQSPSHQTEQPLPPQAGHNPPPATAAGQARAQQFGTEVHALLEQILWWEPETAPAWFQNPQSEAEHIAATALNTPEIRQYFTPAPGVEAYNEQHLEAVTDATWTSAVIDRLLLYPREKQALILDYKTNQTAQGLKNHYRPQMQTYRALVAQATGYPLSRIRAILIHLSHQPTLHPYQESDWEETAPQNPR